MPNKKQHTLFDFLDDVPPVLDFGEKSAREAEHQFDDLIGVKPVQPQKRVPKIVSPYKKK